MDVVITGAIVMAGPASEVATKRDLPQPGSVTVAVRKKEM